MLEPVLIFKDKNDMIPYSKIVVPSSMRSPLWKCFGFPANENNEIITKSKIICCLCRAYIAYNKNTTNLSTHLSCKHPDKLAQIQGKSKGSHTPNKSGRRLQNDSSDETAPTTSKRLKLETKFSNDIDSEWYIEQSASDGENTVHPTGITTKSLIHNKRELTPNVIEFYIDENEEKPDETSNMKKPIRIDENFSLVISPNEQENGNQFHDSLGYSGKEYIECHSNDSAEDVSHKDDFLTEEFLTNINEEGDQREYNHSDMVHISAAKDDSNRIELTNDKSGSGNESKALSVSSHKTRCKDEKGFETTLIMDQLKRFLIKDLVAPSIVEGDGFISLLKSLSPNVQIPAVFQIRNSLEKDFGRVRSKTLSELGAVFNQQKFSLLFNKLGSSSFMEISVCYVNENDHRFDGLERRIASVTKNSGTFLKSIENHLSSCSAFLINFELSECDDQSIQRFSMENEIPIIQTISSVIETVISKCIRIESIKDAISDIENMETYKNRAECVSASCLMKFTFWSQLVDGSEDISAEIMQILPIVQTLVTSLHPLKNCLDALAFESTTYASIMKPIAQELLNQNYIVKETSDDESETVASILKKDLKRTITSVLQEKIISNKFLTMASFLDPRFQSLTSGDDKTSIREELENSIQKPDTSHTKRPEPQHQKTKSERLSGLSSLFAKHAPANKTKMPKNRFDIEFRSYTEDVNLDMDQCPLTWWSESEFLYPNIKRQVVNYFCVPAFVNDMHRQSVDEQNKLLHKYENLSQNVDQELLLLHLNDLRTNTM